MHASPPWHGPLPMSEYLALDVRLCAEHRRQIPDQCYRLRFIPVGATIVLKADQ